MLPLPKTPLNAIKLADWLELGALGSSDRSSSAADLERALRAIGFPDEHQTDEADEDQTDETDEGQADEAIERKILEVFAELGSRLVAAGPGYPFTIDRSLLELSHNWRTYLPYVFCLCLSYFRWQHPRGYPIFPARLFEHLSTIAAGNYVAGDAIRFAAPRVNLPKKFSLALDTLCRDLIKEGDGYKDNTPASSKDRTLDVVAWRKFRDDSPGKLLLFGQCATGADWADKLTELQPGAFCAQWMLTTPPVEPLRAFFIPHRVEEDSWEWYSRRAGIIFDRCRLSFWIAVPDAEGLGSSQIATDCETWTSSILMANQP